MTKDPNSPYLIIVSGPTASGKGSLPAKVIEYATLNNRGFESILIDNLVEQNPDYKNKVREYIEELKIKAGSDEKLELMFLQPTVDMLKKFKDIYYGARTKSSCLRGKGTVCQSDNQCMTCDVLNDTKLKQAFNNKKNIVFETTGEVWPDWLFNFSDNIVKYNVIVAWPIVELCELLKRNKNRAIKSLKDFMHEPPEGPPPRLPDIRLKEYTDALKKIISVFKENNKIEKAKCIEKEDKCIRLLLFDNNLSPESGSKVLYDSKLNSVAEGNASIDRYMADNVCDGASQAEAATPTAPVEASETWLKWFKESNAERIRRGRRKIKRRRSTKTKRDKKKRRHTKKKTYKRSKVSKSN
jgi:hypothetical protein